MTPGRLPMRAPVKGDTEGGVVGGYDQNVSQTYEIKKYKFKMYLL